MSAHAFLSASSAHRWMACPPSAKLSAQYADHGSEAAAQGTDAHALGEYKIRSAIGEQVEDPRFGLKYLDAEMEECTDAYADYVLGALNELRQICPDAAIMVEQRVDFSRWVPDAFGTSDAILVGDGELHIIDLKYGTGVEVSAEHNPQMSCYALGTLTLIDGLYDIERVKTTIFQPRLQNVSEWEISREELLNWAENELKPVAELAAAGKGAFRCGEHCRFCNARHECRARADEQLKLMKYELVLPPMLTDDEVDEILGKLDALTQWAEDIKKYALNAAVDGKQWKGFKLVESRTNRRYKDEEAVANAVIACGKNPFVRKLIGITDMTALLGRKRFNEVLGGLIEKPAGRPTLVPLDDDRPAIEITDKKDIQGAQEYE